MPRFAANLSMLYTEVPFLDRFDRAARSGFAAVEFQFPYEWPVEDIRRRLDDSQLIAVLHNLPAGDWTRGERGIACLPDRVAEFRRGVDQAIAYAKTLGVPQLNCLAGVTPAGLAPAQLRQTLIDNLRYAARKLGDAGLRLLIEAINPRDVPGFYIHNTRLAADLLAEVDEPNLYLQYDVYHAQRSEGELAATLQQHLDRIAHVQIADNPGRHEPGTGEIAFPFLFRHLDAIGYAGWVGCEYQPAQLTEAGLDWMRSIR